MNDLKIFKKNLPSELLEIDLDIFHENSMDPQRMRGLIEELEVEMKSLSAAQKQLKTTHRIVGNIYSREIFIPKGTLLVGKIHLVDSVNICSQGDITLITENGIARVQAPHTVFGKPGIKRVGLAHEDTVWTTIINTEEQDVKKIEEKYFRENYDDIEALPPESNQILLETMEGFVKCQ